MSSKESQQNEIGKNSNISQEEGTENNDNKLNINKPIIDSSREKMSSNEPRQSIKKDDLGTVDGDKDKEKDKLSARKSKVEITPYKISSSYKTTLINALKSSNRERPKFLLAPQKDDITRDIHDLDMEEEERDKEEEEEEKNYQNKEHEDKRFLDKYKESSYNGNTLLQDPMALFSCAERVLIDQFYKLSDLFVICPLYYNYRISLEYCTSESTAEKRELSAYHLFNTKEISPPCSHNCCENQTRQIDINIFNFILGDKDRKVQKFLTLKKNCRCAFACFCACCTRPTFIVETLSDLLGTIVEQRTVCDPIIHINDSNDDLIYIIKGKFCDCGYCCRDRCCGKRSCATCEFIIFDKSGQNSLGLINKDHRSGKKTKPDYDQLIVTYPPSCSCQDKVLLMCSALVIEYLYFQNLSNTSRCSGKPKYLHSFSN